MGRKRKLTTPEEIEKEVEVEKARKYKNKEYSGRDRMPTEEENARVHRWSTWSRQQHTPDEIRAEILKDHRCVCFTYLCWECKFPMSFLEELLVLSTCLLDETNYATDYEAVKNLLFAQMKVGDYNKNLEEITIINRNGPQTVTIKDIGERLDWKAIGLSQKIDLYTAERFAKYLPWDEMTPKCGLSQLFIDANKQLYCKPKKSGEVNKNETIYDTMNSDIEFDFDDDDLDFYVDFED